MYNLVKSVTQFLQSSYPGTVVYPGIDNRPETDEWVELNVEPVYNEQVSYAGDQLTYNLIQIKVYARNYLQSARLMDEMIAIFKQAKIGGLYVGTFRPLGGGSIESGSYFRSFSFPINELH